MLITSNHSPLMKVDPLILHCILAGLFVHTFMTRQSPSSLGVLSIKLITRGPSLVQAIEAV